MRAHGCGEKIQLGIILVATLTLGITDRALGLTQKQVGYHTSAKPAVNNTNRGKQAAPKKTKPPAQKTAKQKANDAFFKSHPGYGNGTKKFVDSHPGYGSALSAIKSLNKINASKKNTSNTKTTTT